MKQSENVFLVRINMGDLYNKLKQYSNSIKMYKMALDMTPSRFEAMRFKVMKKLSATYIQKRDYNDAI